MAARELRLYRRGKVTTLSCKHGFPKTLQMSKESRVVCPVLARKLKLRAKGRRNDLGSVLGKRSDAFLCGTASMLTAALRYNSNTQPGLCLPLIPDVHDPSRPCLGKLRRSLPNGAHTLHLLVYDQGPWLAAAEQETSCGMHADPASSSPEARVRAGTSGSHSVATRQQLGS